MPASYDQLAPGYEFPPARVELSPAVVTKYVEAVEAPPSGFVPPLAVAAQSLAALTQEISLPAGTIHAAQDFQFFKLVPVGSEVKCQARVGRKLSRGGMRMLVLELETRDEAGETVQLGKATLVLPE